MIAQEQKPPEEILHYLNGKRKVVLYGCGGCATVFHTGGEPEVKAMEKTLEVEDCDALLMMCCGDGLQTVWDHIIEDEFGLIKPVYPATNPIGHMGGGPSRFEEKCQQCGECELGRTAGICPLTQCAKGMINGPCGGASQDGKCEANRDQDCAWLRIYRRLEALGSLDQMREIRPPKDWSTMTRPRQIEVEPLKL